MTVPLLDQPVAVVTGADQPIRRQSAGVPAEHGAQIALADLHVDLAKGAAAQVAGGRYL